MSRVKPHVLSLQLAALRKEESASASYEIIIEEGTPFFIAFREFLKDKFDLNETFKYWCTYCEMVEILLHCVRAERDGNWDLHVRVVATMRPYLLLFNHVNYVRESTFYLSDMARLPQEVKTAFRQGHFSVKRKTGKFNSVAKDHALEQTLILSSKVHGGLIGITSNESAMQKWCLLYHFKPGVCRSLEEFCDILQDPTGDLEDFDNKNGVHQG